MHSLAGAKLLDFNAEAKDGQGKNLTLTTPLNPKAVLNINTATWKRL